MKIRLQNGLLFADVSIIHYGKKLDIYNVIVDTGSTGTIFSIDKVADADIKPEPYDPVREIRGVGGTEFVFIKQVDKLTLGDFEINNFDIEVGAMEYGIQINGIIGLDFLLKVKAKLDLDKLEIY
ncbi:MAG: retropepsin-like domain-containing protein [Desulfamplus sp.]|nr:retropepsin-like domain-containing protein [Desulfamplus sp.]